MAAGLATHLPAEHFEVWLCTSRAASGQPIDALRAAGVRHLHLGRREGRLDPLAFRKLAAALRRERIDVLHAHMFGSNVWGTVLGRLCCVPVVVAHEQTWSYEGQPLRRLIDGRVIGRLADAFVAVSEADGRRMIELEKVPPDRVVLLPNAHIPRGGDADVRAELKLPRGSLVVGTIAVFRAQKALDVLVQAFAIVARSIPAAHLVLAGDGACRAALERQVAEAGLDARVHFLGLRQDVDAVWRSFDVGAMSSDFEGMPLAALECLANGVPLVATDVGGVRDALRHGHDGLLVPRRDPAALAAALEEVLVDPTRREALAVGARERGQEFGIQCIAERFGDLYLRLLAGQRPHEAGATSRP